MLRIGNNGTIILLCEINRKRYTNTFIYLSFLGSKCTAVMILHTTLHFLLFSWQDHKMKKLLRIITYVLADLQCES